jgi:flagellar biosynthesis/type III secretory pathway protein FliH
MKNEAEKLIAKWEEDDSLEHSESPLDSSMCVICDWMESAVSTLRAQAAEIERLNTAFMDGYEGGKQDARDAAHNEICGLKNRLHDNRNEFMAALAKVCTAYGKPGECIYIQMRHAMKGETK